MTIAGMGEEARLVGKPFADPSDLSNKGKDGKDGKNWRDVVRQEFYLDDALNVYWETRELPDEEKFVALRKWVMPNKEHPLRVAGAFTTLSPIPGQEDGVAFDEEQMRRAKEEGKTRVEIGGNLVSPAIELVLVAKQLGRLDELQKSLGDGANVAGDVQAGDGAKAAHTFEDWQRRSRLLMLGMIAMAQDDANAAEDAWKELQTLVVAPKPSELRSRVRGARWAALARLAGRPCGIEISRYKRDRRRNGSAHAGERRCGNGDGPEAMLSIDTCRRLTTVAKRIENHGSLLRSPWPQSEPTVALCHWLPSFGHEVRADRPAFGNWMSRAGWPRSVRIITTRSISIRPSVGILK